MGRRGQVEVKVGAERGKSDDDLIDKLNWNHLIEFIKFNKMVPKICEK